MEVPYPGLALVFQDSTVTKSFDLAPKLSNLLFVLVRKFGEVQYEFDKRFDFSTKDRCLRNRSVGGFGDRLIFGQLREL